MIYDAVNQPVVGLIGTRPARILDLGCGTGDLGKRLKSLGNHFICGVTYSEEEAKLARASLDQVLVADLNFFEPRAMEPFDIIICSHVLEHLYEPQDFLRRLHPYLRPEGKLIIALPNVLFWRQRLKFLAGTFRYTDGGLLDRTHFRFFDNVSARSLPAEAGYRVSRFFADGSLPMPIMRKILPSRLTRKIDLWSVSRFPGWFGFQFVMVCHRG